MNTYLLTWNPNRWTWDTLEKDIAAVERGQPAEDRWSTGNNKSIRPGDRFFLLRQATDRGIIGSGTMTSKVFEDRHWDGADRTAKFVTIRFDHLLPIEDVLPLELLISAVPEVSWNRIQGSGISVPSAAAGRLEQLWFSHLEGIGRVPAPLPEEVIGARHYLEGATQLISVNSYERNSAARRACIDHFGLDCSVCGFNFRKVYGEFGADFIHIHHLRDLATIGEEYAVDPIKDLRPVCPNCHAMLHANSPAMPIDELRTIMANVASGGR